MANWSSAHNKTYGFSEDLEEDDVWNSVDSNEDFSNFITSKSTDYYYSSSSSSSSSSTWRLPSAPKLIPKSISTKTHETQMVTNGSSAPVDIPDWSKIYGKKGTSAGEFSGECDRYIEYDYGEEDDMVPPHEWIAQKLARSRISSFSVCEGAGRTLKGRDLSKVRNAILTKTGFLE